MSAISETIGEYVTNGVQAIKGEVLAELKQHGKASITFRVKYKQGADGIEVDIERRLAHSADVVKTSVGKIKQPNLPGM